MRTAVMTWFVLIVIGLVVKLTYLTGKEYPRVEKNSMGKDTVNALISIIFMGWLAYLLWG